MILKQETALIEAILFLESDPIDVKNLSKISALSVDAVKTILEQLKDMYASEERGLELTRLGDAYLLSPKEVLWENLKNRYGKKNEQRLSRAALETLSIIAYSQPLTRGEIEGIRGVSSDSMIRLLLDKELISEVGKKDAPGHPIQFGTNKNFLKLFKLASIADLPKLDELEQERFELDGDE
jgi:segregation and condensation protein B